MRTSSAENDLFPVANGHPNVAPILLRNWRKPGHPSKLLDVCVRNVQNQKCRSKRSIAGSIKAF